MGVVFRAHDPEMGRDVALKVVRLDPALEPAEKEEIQRRFDREAKAAGGLNHPNIVAHYERGEAGVHRFIAMELVEGRALHKVMAEGPKLELPAALSILRRMAAALDYAHSRGVVHRDIKPANVLLPNEGGVKIADFGIAKNNLTASLTAPSMVLGSPHYMAPEQVEGRTVTGRTDQWALAVTAYELIAGRKPFDSDSIAALFQQILATQPRDPSECDPSVPSSARQVFLRALSKDPQDRFENCTAFVEALVSAAASPTPMKPLPIVPPLAKRSRRPLWIGLGAMVASLGGGAIWLLPRLQETREQHANNAPGGTSAAAVDKGGVPVNSSPAIRNGEARVNRRDNLVYIWIAPGKFRMGCSPGDTDCQADETPHDVSLTRGYWFGQSEVTVEAFRHFTLATEAVMPKPPDDNPNWSDRSTPISNVAWSAASSYCRWIGGRLPTEAEWEFAARAGSTQLRYGPLAQIAWFGGNSKSHAHPVMSLHPNAFGLFDLLGNVWEWTADRYARDYYTNSPKEDPRGPDTGDYRVLRGGSWFRSAAEIRVSLRYPTMPDSPDQLVGFRCAANELP
jgi:serine/threonine-protein kinase